MGFESGLNPALSPFVKILVRPLFILCIFTPLLSVAKDDSIGPIPGDQAMCPLSMELNDMEKDAYIGFHGRLSRLNSHYGKDSFDTKLNELLQLEWPTTKVIDTSPLFVEKVLNKVEQQYLIHAIASTIGLDHPQWDSFFRVMRGVTLYVYENPRGIGNSQLFAKNTEKLMTTIRDLPLRKMKKKNVSQEEASLLKARALTMIANMHIYLERQSAINGELLRLRVQALKAKFTFNLIRYGAIGILVVSTIYAGPLIAIAGTAARGLVADIIVGSQLAKLGQVVAGGGLGVVGAPVGYALTSSSSAMYQAQTDSLNNGTVYACELNKKFQEWKSQGASPYLSAAVKGGGLGLIGGALTLTRAGAQIVLYGTTFGVGVGQVYALSQMNDNTMRGLAEYRLAIMAQESGDNELAKKHLRQSREYFKIAGEKRIESLVISILSISFASGDLRAALLNGEDMIRVMYANSSDTLPQAFQSAIDLTLSVAEGAQ